MTETQLVLFDEGAHDQTIGASLGCAQVMQASNEASRPSGFKPMGGLLSRKKAGIHTMERHPRPKILGE